MFAPSPLLEVAEIRRRLETIFPDGIADRSYVVRDSAAKTVFVLLYLNAVQGEGIWLAPQHVYRFTQQQAALQDIADRSRYAQDCLKKNYVPDGDRWYADNSREQIRDETLKDGFIIKGAVVVDASVPTTSNRGRYALQHPFAALFRLAEQDFEPAALAWQRQYLNPAELARVRIMQQRQSTDAAIQVLMPNGEIRNLLPGGSSHIAKAVVEQFAPRFLKAAAVLWISESGNKVVLQDDQLLRDLHLPIDQQRLLPDMVLADLGRAQTLLVFVEIVYSDGPVTQQRKAEILRMTTQAGFAPENVVFVSAFEQRNSSALKRRFSGIAVDTLVWCVAEPDLLIWLGEAEQMPFEPAESEVLGTD